MNRHRTLHTLIFPNQSVKLSLALAVLSAVELWQLWPWPLDLCFLTDQIDQTNSQIFRTEDWIGSNANDFRKHGPGHKCKRLTIRHMDSGCGVFFSDSVVRPWFHESFMFSWFLPKNVLGKPRKIWSSIKSLVITIKPINQTSNQTKQCSSDLNNRRLDSKYFSQKISKDNANATFMQAIAAIGHGFLKFWPRNPRNRNGLGCSVTLKLEVCVDRHVCKFNGS